MTRPTHTHGCPGCGAEGVPYHHVACKPCWRRLPQHLALPFRTVRMGTAAHRVLLANALDWYRRQRAQL